MEQKKLLLVAISVGVFFIIVIGSALVFFKPSGTGAGDIVRAAVSPDERRSSDTALIGTGYNFDPEPTDVIILPPQDAEGFDFELSVVSPDPVISPGSLITIAPGSSAGVPDATDRYPAQRTHTQTAAGSPSVSADASGAETQPAASAQTQTGASQQATPISGASGASAAQSGASRSTGSASTTAPAASRQPSPPRTRDDFWVQTGAFTVLSRAENVRQSLAERGITSIIENRDVEGTLYFRVRIGPYTSQNEAEYWLNLIKAINGFEGSQIRKTQTIL